MLTEEGASNADCLGSESNRLDDITSSPHTTIDAEGTRLEHCTQTDKKQAY